MKSKDAAEIFCLSHEILEKAIQCYIYPGVNVLPKTCYSARWERIFQLRKLLNQQMKCVTVSENGITITDTQAFKKFAREKIRAKASLIIDPFDASKTENLTLRLYDRQNAYCAVASLLIDDVTQNIMGARNNARKKYDGIAPDAATFEEYFFINGAFVHPYKDVLNGILQNKLHIGDDVTDIFEKYRRANVNYINGLRSYGLPHLVEAADERIIISKFDERDIKYFLTMSVLLKFSDDAHSAKAMRQIYFNSYLNAANFKVFYPAPKTAYSLKLRYA